MTWTEVSDNSSTWIDIERYEENTLPYSEDWSKWTKTVTVSGQTITDSSTTAARNMNYTCSDFLSDYQEEKPRVFSITVQKDSVPASTRVSAIRIGYVDTSHTVTLRFDTSTGETYPQNSPIDYGVIEKDDTLRFWIADSAPSSLLNVIVYPALTYGTLSSAVNVLATGSLTVLNAQFEDGVYPSRYIYTNGSGVTWEEV